jgi:hypothetical protein
LIAYSTFALWALQYAEGGCGSRYLKRLLKQTSNNNNNKNFFLNAEARYGNSQL